MSFAPDNLKEPYLLQGKQWTWEIATLYPAQGDWTEEEYLDLTDSTNRLIEFTDGYLEFLAMPTKAHQRIARCLFVLLNQFVDAHGLGEVFFAPLRVYIRADKYREPDIIFEPAQKPDDSSTRYSDAAQLVVEVVSDDPESHKRDYKTKILDYAAAKIPEYWIVDPQQKQITVLTLDGEKYATHGVFVEGQHATSKLLADFSVDTSAVFAAAKG